MKAVRRVDGCLIFPEDFARLNRQQAEQERRERQTARQWAYLIAFLLLILAGLAYLNLQSLP